MEQNAKQNKLPLLGMIVTTALVLGALCALLWWSINRMGKTARALLVFLMGNSFRWLRCNQLWDHDPS